MMFDLTNFVFGLSRQDKESRDTYLRRLRGTVYGMADGLAEDDPHRQALLIAGANADRIVDEAFDVAGHVMCGAIYAAALAQAQAAQEAAAAAVVTPEERYTEEEYREVVRMLQETIAPEPLPASGPTEASEPVPAPRSAPVRPPLRPAPPNPHLNRSAE
jgi:hypothetical protein